MANSPHCPERNSVNRRHDQPPVTSGNRGRLIGSETRPVGGYGAVGTREMSPRSWRGGSPDAFHQLRSRWRTASLAAGWPFPNDWALAEVDVVCQTALS